MAVTRIKNNQITDATINAASKLVDYSITAGKLANSLTYGSDLTITGNLTVNGATTTVSTTTTTVEDAIMVLNSDATGSFANDTGLYLERGDNTSVFMGYDGSETEFALVETSSAGTDATMTITDYADLRLGGLTADDAISATGNVTGGNLITGGLASVTGNITGGNLVTGGVADVTGNITGGNLITAGLVSATGNVTGGNINTAGLVSATGNVTGGNLTTAGDVTTATVNATGNITGGNLTTAGLTSTGDLTVLASGTVEFNQNVLGNVADPVSTQDAATKNYVDSLLSSGFTIVDSANNSQTISQGDTMTLAGTSNEVTVTVSSTDTITFGLPTDVTIQGNLTVQGTQTILNTDTLVVEDKNIILANGAADSAAADGAGITVDGPDATILYVHATTSWDFNKPVNVTGAFDATGNVSGGNVISDAQVVATGNITGGNIITGGLVDATGNVDGANFNTGGLVSATGNVTGGNLVTGGVADVTGNITGGNLITGGLVNATGNVDGANFNTAGLVSATGNVTGGNLVTGGVADVTGNITGGNLITAGILSTASILESATDVVINETGADVNFRVESDNNANMIFVDAGTDSVNIGTGTPTTDVSFKVGTSDSVLIATGNTAQRPATGVVGMLRYNTSTDSLEQYTSADGWETVGVPAFTVIASETFDGDNSTVAFTLSEAQTTASCIVSINGVVQLPTTAYGVSGTTLTFTEAPLSGDKIEVRKITTTTTVTNISSTSGGATVEANNEEEIDIKGNLMPAADSTYSIGNATVRWTDIFVDAGSIHLGNIVLKESGGELALFAADGTTPADITAGSLGAVSADAISNGTSNVKVNSSGGTITATVGGTSILTIDSTGIINNQADGVGNIGNATVGFNTVHAKATSAQYADLAEKYEADADYEPGTVVHFGGEKEVAQCDVDHCTKVAGVVSTSPAYRMNDGLEAEHVAMVALTGRVPCKVQGPVAKGDMMVSAGNGKARAEANPKVGAVIGKALEDFNGEEGVIEVVIGKH